MVVDAVRDEPLSW